MGRFCEDCGVSTVPLAVPHVERPCGTCDKTMYVVEAGDGREGIHVREGDRFTIPAGFIRMSLDPSQSNGRLSRHGVTWLVSQFILGGLPQDADGLTAYLASLKERANGVLEDSELLAEFDLNDAAEAERAFEFLQERRETTEWHAYILGASLAQLDELFADPESSKDEVAVWLARAVASHMMVIYKQQLDDHVWAGYRQSQLIYDVARAAATTPAEVAALDLLRPALEKVPEDVLAAWVNGGVNVRERLGVPSEVSDAVVNAFAEYQLGDFERRRQAARDARSDKRAVWGNRIAGAGVGVALASAVAAFLALGGGPDKPAAPVASQTPSASVSASPTPRPTPTAAPRPTPTKTP